MKVSVPEGKSGPWEVSRFTVAPEDAMLGRMRLAFGHSRDYVPEGEYTRLTCGGKVVMSDTPAEWNDLSEMRWRSKNAQSVLLHGLGLGLALVCLSELECHVTVVEKSQDVLTLSGNHYARLFGDRLTIIHDDALTWKPPKRLHWDIVWHDIWSDICADNLPEMTVLCRRFGSRAGWQGCWAREYIRK